MCGEAIPASCARSRVEARTCAPRHTTPTSSLPARWRRREPPYDRVRRSALDLVRCGMRCRLERVAVADARWAARPRRPGAGRTARASHLASRRRPGYSRASAPTEARAACRVRAAATPARSPRSPGPAARRRRRPEEPGRRRSPPAPRRSSRSPARCSRPGCGALRRCRPTPGAGTELPRRAAIDRDRLRAPSSPWLLCRASMIERRAYADNHRSRVLLDRCRSCSLPGRR
jgi:hypothetical protein